MNSTARYKNQESLTHLELNSLNGDAESVRDEVLKIISDDHAKGALPIDEECASLQVLLAVAYKDEGKFDVAIDILESVCKYFKEESIHPLRGETLVQLSVCYRHQSRYRESLETLDEARLVFTAHHNKPKLAKYELLLGLVYYQLSYYEEAIVRTNKALSLYEEALAGSGNHPVDKLFCQVGIASCYHTLGLIYLDSGNREFAFENLNKAKERAKDLKNPRLLGFIYQDLGRYYTDFKYKTHYDTFQAKKHLKKALGYRDEAKDRKGIVACDLFFGQLKEVECNWSEALKFYQRSKAAADKMDALEIRKQAAHGIYYANLRIGNESKALEAVRDFEDLSKQEAKKKIENRLNLERVYPRDRELNELVLYKKRTESMIADLSLAIRKIANESKGVKKFDVDEEFASRFQLLPDLLESEENRIPGIRLFAECILNSGQKDKPHQLDVFREEYNKDRVEELYYELLNEKFIPAMGKKAFCDVLFPEKGNVNGLKIKWLGLQRDLVFFIYFLYANDALDSTFVFEAPSNTARLFRGNEGEDLTGGNLAQRFCSHGIALNAPKHIDYGLLHPRVKTLQRIVEEWAHASK